MPKMNLTEATILALQGKLNLEESIDISIQDDSTMIDTDESTVIIQNKEELEDVEETECEDCEEPEVVEVPIEGEETIIPEQEIPEEQVKEITSEEVPTVEEIADGETDLDESKECKTEGVELSNEMTDDEIVDKIINGYEEITGTPIDDIFTPESEKSEDSPIFNQEVIDSVSDKILKVLDDAGITGKRLEDVLYLLDDKLAMIKTGEVEEEPEPEFAESEPELDESKKVTEGKDTPELVQKAKDWKKRVTASKDEDELEQIVEEIMDAVKDLSETNWAAEDLYNGAEGVMDDQDAADRGPATYIRSVKTNFKNILTDFINNYADACADAELDEGKKVKTESIDEDLDVSEMLRKILEYYQDNAMSDSFFEDLSNIVDYDKVIEWFKSIELDESKKVENKEEVKEQCDCGYSKKTFNEVFTKYYKDTISKTESFETIKVLKNDKAIKVEGKLNLTNGNSKDITLTLNKVQEGTSFTKYELHESGLLKESKSSVAKLMTRTNNNVIKCCYITK